mmetsp:Transcript_8451/g.13712  ORF Transcript_8451/g.13712 Transcript_8451/m.13712 type:complete len:242 (+) Transcript_8451:319-1044(+)
MLKIVLLAVVSVHVFGNKMAWRCSSQTNAGLVMNLRAASLIKSDRVQKAMEMTDRAFYTESAPYEDSPQRIGYMATISAPHMHAMALEYLSPALNKENCKVLDVGCGSGYLAACLHRMVQEQNGSVYGVDYIPELVELSKRNLMKDDKELLDKVPLETRDGWKGWSKYAPFDAIHVGAAAASVPEELVKQLKPGGRMIIPVGPNNGDQELLMIDKSQDGESFTSESVCGVRYVPLVDTDKL